MVRQHLKKEKYDVVFNWRWHPGSPEQLSTFRGLDEDHVPGIGRRTYFYHLLFYPRLQDMIVFVYFFHES